MHTETDSDNDSRKEKEEKEISDEQYSILLYNKKLEKESIATQNKH